MEIERLTIIGGYGKNGKREPVDQVILEMGDLSNFMNRTKNGCQIRIEGLLIG
ncbi:MAG: hypothetical protein V2A79_03540 [Planctomycetota bacterium]